MDLRDAVAYHQLVLNAGGARPATQTNYLHYERKLLEALESLGIPPSLDVLTTANVRRTTEWYRENMRHGTSRGGKVAVRQYVERIKTFARFLEAEEIIPPDTLKRLAAPKIDKILRRPYEQSEVAAMWGACRASRNAARDEALLLLLLDTGMRIGEAAALTMDNLRLDDRRAIIGAPGKGRRERIVPLGDGSRRDGGRLIRALRAYLAVRPGSAAPEVFVSDAGYSLSSLAAGQAIQRLGRASGVFNPIPHRLRHTFCTWYLVMFPGDELGLREIVGHLSKNVLSDYVHFAHSIVAERVGRASLSGQWLGATSARSPSPAARQTTVGVPTPNEQPRRVAEPQPRSGRKTASTIEKPESKRNDPDTFNVAKYPREALRYFPPGTPYAF